MTHESLPEKIVSFASSFAKWKDSGALRKKRASA